MAGATTRRHRHAALPAVALGEAADLVESELNALAMAAFGSRERAQRWLRRPRREFGGVAPLEMLETPAATRQVIAVLRQLAAERAERDG